MGSNLAHLVSRRQGAVHAGSMQAPDASSSARATSERALALERLRSSRLVARSRFIGISFAFAFNWALPIVAPASARYQGSVTK